MSNGVWYFSLFFSLNAYIMRKCVNYSKNLYFVSPSGQNTTGNYLGPSRWQLIDPGRPERGQILRSRFTFHLELSSVMKNVRKKDKDYFNFVA